MKEIKIKDLTFAYGKKQKIINHLTVTIPTGFTLLVGPTGCGKSTLLKLLAGLYPKYGGHAHGEISLGTMSKAMMFQNPGEQFTMPTPRQEIIFALENLHLNQKEYEQRLKRAVAFTKIDKLLDQKIATLSGGEKQRVALAVLVAMNVNLFLLDEPFASCDPAARQFLIQKLEQLRQQGKMIILSDHLLSGYEKLCDQILAFSQKGIQLLSAAAQKALFARQKKQSELTYHFVLPSLNTPLFKLQNAQIRQQRLLLQQKKLIIPAGKSILLTGPNGVGKTSFFKALTKMIPYEGQIHFNAREIARLPARRYLKQVAQVFQSADDQFLRITVQEEIDLSKKMRNAFFTDQKIKAALQELDLTAHRQQVVYSLSGGQKKKLQLLLMLMTKHQVLLIDEPLAGLDQKSVSQVINLLAKVQAKLGLTYIIISHQVGKLGKFCDYHLVFKQQQMHYQEV